MNIGIYQETKPVTGSNVLVGAIYKKTAPTVLISSHTWTGPYTGQTQTFSFAGLVAVVYTYICWESPDGSASGTVRNQFDIQPASNSFNVRDNLYLTADVSPFFSSGTNTYGADSSLVGWNWYPELKAQGSEFPNTDYVKTKAGVDTTLDDTNADGFRLATIGQLIGPNEEWVIHFYPQLSTSSTVVPSNTISDTQLLSINTSLDSSAIGKSFLLQGTGGYFQITLPSIATVPTNEPLFFYSCGGSHINVGIFAFSGDQIIFCRNGVDFSSGPTISHIYLGQSESLGLYKFTNTITSASYWLVMMGGEGYKAVGEQVFSESLQILNTVPKAGQLLSRTNYARLWEWVQFLGPLGQLVADSSWALTNPGGINGQSYFINKAKYSTGDGSSTFRMPDLTVYGFQRIVNNGSRLSGSQEIGHVESHDHTMHGSGSIDDSGSHPASPKWYLSRQNGSYSGPGGNLFGRSVTPGAIDTTLRTGNDNNRPTSGSTLVTETAPNNTGIYALVRC